MQVLNVARGGTLLQHLPESHGHDEHRRNPGSFDGADHVVRLDERLARRARGGRGASTRPSATTTRPSTASGEGLVVTGLSDLDELPEAIELPGPALRARRAVASRGRRDEPPDRLAGRGGVRPHGGPRAASLGAGARRRLRAGSGRQVDARELAHRERRRLGARPEARVVLAAQGAERALDALDVGALDDDGRAVAAAAAHTRARLSSRPT